MAAEQVLAGVATAVAVGVDVGWLYVAGRAA